MNYKRIITIEWWPTDVQQCPEVKEEHKNELNDNAMERVTEMMAETFICGELIAEDVDGINYRGWWELKESDMNP